MILLFLSGFFSVAGAAFEFRPGSARAGGLGDTFAGWAEGVDALFWNPGAVAWGRRAGVMGGYERPFGVAELETQVFGAMLPLDRGALGVGFQEYGFSLYRERALGVTLGYRVVSRLGVGVSVRRLQVAVAGSGSRGWTVFDLGVRVLPAPGLALGLVAWNAGGTKVGLLGQGGMAGVGFEVAPGLALLVDVRKEAGTPTGVSAGLEYGIGDRLWLRGGAGGRPERLSAGVGVRHGVFRVDYAAVYHTVLGVSHRVSVAVGGLGR